jgi:hypothetical protein
MSPDKRVHVNARRWFDKVNGNTYHSVAVSFPDGTTKTTPFDYGYGSHYEYTALKLVAGDVPRYENGNPIPPWRWYQDNGYLVTYDVVAVAKRKDLHRPGCEQ